MSSHVEVAARYWGYLIQSDKRPTPVFEQLLLGIANYINRHIAPWDTSCLTPAKLAHFYRLVGGDYDPLFLDTPQASLSFIYRSLGCFHTLQPSQDPYAAPSSPALTPRGFVRWQTVQLLLSPEEHVHFLQEAVKRFDLINPSDGEAFPSFLPKEALPGKPDQEMTEWHDAVSARLKVEAHAAQDREIPSRSPMALSDGELDSSRPTSADSYSIESQSIVDAASYFQHPTTFAHRPQPTQAPFTHVPPTSCAPPSPVLAHASPWSTLRRSSSYPSQPQSVQKTASWPPGRHFQAPSHPTPSRPQNHARTPSTLSTSSYASSSTSSSSSVTTSSASLSPVRYHAHVPPPSQAQADRRNIMGIGVPIHRPTSQAYVPYPSHPRQPAGASGPNERGWNVRWGDQGMGSGWTTPKQGIPAYNCVGMAGNGVSRAKSVGARPLVGKYAGREAEDRGRGTQYFPRGVK